MPQSQRSLSSSNYDGVAITPVSLKRRRHHHVNFSINYFHLSAIVSGSSILLCRTSNGVGGSSFSPFGAGASSSQPYYPISRTSIIMNNFSPWGNQNVAAFTIRHQRRSPSFKSRGRRTILYYSASSSEFPSQDYIEDPNIEWDDMASSSIRSNDFRRPNYKRLGVIPDSRRDNNMIITGNNNDGMFQNDDEWESYLDMDAGMDDGGETISIDDDEGGKVVVERIPRQQVESSNKVVTAGAGSGANHSLSRAGSMSNNRVSNPDTEGKTSHVIDLNATNQPFASVDDTRNNAHADEPPESQPFKPTSQSRRRITTDQINLLKSSISLVDVIESFNLAHFTRSSSNSYTQSTTTATAKACCPFHDDRNPSMSIDNSRGLYKCFVCDAGGDVFNFIREYDYLDKAKKGQEKMGYMQAVEYVAREFGDTDLVSDWNFGRRAGSGNYEGMSDEAKENIRQREWKKERIRQANTAAAAFYTKCLITLPSAGKARTHLRTRNLSPVSIRTFAIGYAPDCYYGDEAKMSKTTSDTKKKSWGTGSLVEYLAEAGFSPDEIVEAGLAVRTKRQQLAPGNQSNEVNDGTTEFEDGAEDEQQHDYSYLMDRFRSRLIIPIFDESGQSVIALGGRNLEGATDGSDDKSSFTPAKYLNSPDSLVFTKKNVLFNQARAKQAIENQCKNRQGSLAMEESASSEKNASTFDAPPAVVIVEGYLDAIALSNVGIQNVVASMGTALPFEQLKAAAEMGNVPGGRIVLCMDRDDAGRNAVERLCGSNILWKVPELNRNELYVATIPDGDVNIKDPADFVNSGGGGDKARERFQKEILDQSMPWDEWYVARLLSKYDVDAKDGTEGSFAAVCNQVSTFLASFPSPADRTRRVHKIAEMLVTLIADDDSSLSALSMLRVQLEADVLNMASRKAGVREAMERRIEQTDGLMGEATTSKIERLATGDFGAISDDERKMSKNALAKSKSIRIESPQRRIIPVAAPARQRRVQSRTQSFQSNYQQRDMQLPERHVVPHFNGFIFKHQSDKDWLGLSGNGNMKRRMHLGEVSAPREENRIRADTPVFESNGKMKQKRDGIVYFNSNRFLGFSPGDERSSSSGESIVEVTERKLLESPDPDQLIMQAESRLLHALAKFPQARMAMRTVYSTSTFGPSNLRWSRDEREWLFLCLTGSPDIDPPLPAELLDGGTRLQLHLYLAKRNDCPDGALSNDFKNPLDDSSSVDGSEVNQSVTEEPMSEKDAFDSILDDTRRQNGSLDEYFLDTDMFPSFTNNTITTETRAELTVQETVATLLRATAMKRFASAKSKLTRIVNEMDRRANDDAKIVNFVVASNEFSRLPPDELQELFKRVGNEVVDAQRSLYESERSTDRVNSHLLDYSVTSGVQYKLSQAKLDRLDRMMDEFIASLPEDNHRPESPGNDGNYVFGSDQFDDNIDPTYGGTSPEEYVVRGLPNGEGKWD